MPEEGLEPPTRGLLSGRSVLRLFAADWDSASQGPVQPRAARLLLRLSTEGLLRQLRCPGSRYPDCVSHPPLSTTPTAEKPALSETQRAERLRLLARRLRSPGGLDRDALKHIERLTGDER